MGSRTSAIVSEICMQSLETTAITTTDHPPKVWERHVDDVFSIVHKAYLQKLLDHINNLHPQTQFTKEEENNSILPFLDTLVQRNYDKAISVKIYIRPTHTNKYLEYTSHKPTSANQSAIAALFDRADNAVFNEKDKIEEKHHILATLQQNSYPKEFIQRTVKKQSGRKEQPRECPEEEPKQTKSIKLPYIQGVRGQIKPAVNKHNIKATFYTQTTFRNLLSKPKDPIPKEGRNTVYQLNCKDCEAVYAGETKRTLNIRAEEHITATHATHNTHLLGGGGRGRGGLVCQKTGIISKVEEFRTAPPIQKCFKCHGFGHKAPNCTKKTEMCCLR